MSLTYPLIKFGIMSLKNFQDKNLAESVINKINEYGENFIPDLFDVYEPMKRKYKSEDMLSRKSYSGTASGTRF